MKMYQANPALLVSKQSILTENILLYLIISLLQQENVRQVLSSTGLSNADSGEKSSGSGKSTTGTGSAGAGHTSGSDDDDISNPGADLINNTGDDIRLADFGGTAIAEVPKPDSDTSSKESSNAEVEAAAASPGGTGENRIVGGSNNEDIDWDDVVDEGTEEADAATG